ncbi:MAG: hypothetical protein Kow0088_23350 [Anaerolineales bacterium]
MMFQETSLIGPRLIFRGFFIGSIFVALVGFYLSRQAVLPTLAEASIPATSSERPSVESQPENISVTDVPLDIHPECPLDEQFPPKVRRWCELITAAAEKYELPPNLIAAVIWIESGGDPKAYSHSGAVGLMQVMPRDGLASQFQCANGPCFANRPTIEQLQDPKFNINYGSKLLASLLKRHGTLRDALRAYGPMQVGYTYADKVLSIYKRVKE